MRKPKDIEINGKRLDIILEEHIHWLNEDIYGWESMRADLHGTDLCGACLYGANLYATDLHDTDLSGADLCGANLYGADLRSTDLSIACLRDANLYGANLYCADLHDANLHGARLYNANLRSVDLHDANLRGADLSGADLRGANLYGANLYGTNLYGANLYGANGNLIQYRKGKILTESIIGYKKCKNNIIITLEIPRGAVVFSINGDKCRTNKARVIAIDGADRAYSFFNNTSYYIGDEFIIYNFDCEYNNECASGIHFFVNKERAIEYEY